jgi:micrococcal nuclease
MGGGIFRMKRNLKTAQMLAFVMASATYLGLRALSQPSDTKPPEQETRLYVNRAVDGDTLNLSNSERVRLIGVDTPEHHFSDKLMRDARRSQKDIKTVQELGKRSTAFTRKLCVGKKVSLEFDVTKRDRFGRLLAYVYLDDGTFVNARILEEGYGQVMTIPPNVKYAELFLRLEREARDSKKGLWGED